MVSSLPPLRTAIGTGGLPDHAAAQLLGTSVLCRVRQAAKCPTAGTRQEEEPSGAIPSAGVIPHVVGNLLSFLQVGPVLLWRAAGCSQCSAVQWEMLLQGSKMPCFQAKLHPSPNMLCSLSRQRCHEHHAAKEQLDSTGPDPIQWEGKTGASQDIFSCIVGFRSPALQRQHRFCTLIEKNPFCISNVIFQTCYCLDNTLPHILIPQLEPNFPTPTNKVLG